MALKAEAPRCQNLARPHSLIRMAACWAPAFAHAKHGQSNDKESPRLIGTFSKRCLCGQPVNGGHSRHAIGGKSHETLNAHGGAHSRTQKGMGQTTQCPLPQIAWKNRYELCLKLNGLLLHLPCNCDMVGSVHLQRISIRTTSRSKRTSN